jgi:hypothetical protein
VYKKYIVISLFDVPHLRHKQVYIKFRVELKQTINICIYIYIYASCWSLYVCALNKNNNKHNNKINTRS